MKNTYYFFSRHDQVYFSFLDALNDKAVITKD